MMMITKEQLREIMPYASEANIDKYLPHLNDTMMSFNIDTPLRQAHFLAQLGHESGSLRYVREIASGEAYEGRRDLGNVCPGDGVKFKGRGLIQLTGRANYESFDFYIAGNGILLEHPEKVEQPDLACLVAGWFWDVNDLNALADRDDIVRVTRRVNGGQNGLQDRMEFLNRAKIALNINS